MLFSQHISGALNKLAVGHGTSAQNRDVYIGNRSVKTLQLAAGTAYATNNYWGPIGGKLYEVIKPAGTPTGGAYIPLYVGLTDTAATIAYNLSVLINAQSTSTATANSDLNGLLTITEKTIGSAGQANVSIGGTAPATYVLIQAGTDAIVDGGPIKDFTGTWTTDAQTLQIPDLACDVNGGIDLDFALKLKTGSGIGATVAIDGGSGYVRHYSVRYDGVLTGGSNAAAYICGISAGCPGSPGDWLIGNIRYGGNVLPGRRRAIEVSCTHTYMNAQILETIRSSILQQEADKTITLLTFALTAGATFDGPASSYKVRRI